MKIDGEKTIQDLSTKYLEDYTNANPDVKLYYRHDIGIWRSGQHPFWDWCESTFNFKIEWVSKDTDSGRALVFTDEKRYLEFLLKYS